MKIWQECPVCHGVGLVSGGFFTRAGDCPFWVAKDTTEECRVCKGKGIIETPERAIK